MKYQYFEQYFVPTCYFLKMALWTRERNICLLLCKESKQKHGS